MAKFNSYLINAVDDDGIAIVNKNISAISYESAWHKAVTAAFEAIEPGTGIRPCTIHVHRISSPSEHHG